MELVCDRLVIRREIPSTLPPDGGEPCDADSLRRALFVHLSGAKGPLVLDFQGIAGPFGQDTVAALVEAARDARIEGRDVELADPPESLLDRLDVSGLADLFILCC